MKAEYLQRGEALDYTNATENTIPAGAIVTIGTKLGVTYPAAGYAAAPAAAGDDTILVQLNG